MRCKTHKTLSNIRNASKKHLFGIIVQYNKKYKKVEIFKNYFFYITINQTVSLS